MPSHDHLIIRAGIASESAMRTLRGRLIEEAKPVKKNELAGRLPQEEAA